MPLSTPNIPSQENYPLRSALTNKINSIPSRTKSFPPIA